jgi:hypothetical protein
VAIWQDLVDSCGFASGYQSVRRFVSKLHPNQSPEACAGIETAPGEEAQVDYGAGPMVRDQHSGKYGALPPLRSGHLPDRFFLTKPNTSSTIEMPASLRSERCSPSDRNAVRAPVGISVRLRRNPHIYSWCLFMDFAALYLLDLRWYNAKPSFCRTAGGKPVTQSGESTSQNYSPP